MRTPLTCRAPFLDTAVSSGWRFIGMSFVAPSAHDLQLLIARWGADRSTPATTGRLERSGRAAVAGARNYQTSTTCAVRWLSPCKHLFLYPALPLESANAMCANISASTAPEHLFSKPAHRLRDGFLRCMSTIRRATLRFMGNWSMGQACLLTLFLRLVRAQPFDLHACPSPILARAPRGICVRGKSC